MAPNSTAALAAGEGQTSEAAAVTAAATSAIQTTAPAQQQQQQPPPTTALAATHALDGSLLTKYNLMHHHGGIATMPLHHPFVHANGAFVQQPGGAIGIHHPAGAALVTRGDPRAFVGHPAVTMNHPPTAVFSPTIAPSIPSADGTEVSNYKDYSKHTGDSMSEQQHAPSTTSSGKDPSFPVKLHRILSAADHEEFITWLPHGRSWRVLKPKAFEAKIIPLYFRHAKYASFMRQVNGWGFKRITQGPDHNSYYHELFLRGLPHLCHKMTRPPKTKNGATPPQDNNTVHPDFYHLSMVAPLPPAGGAAVARQTQPQAPHQQQFQPQSVYITSASSASPALTATEASGEGSGERSSNYSDDVGGASDESGSGKERGDRVTRPTSQGGRVASDSSSADSKEQDAGSDGANSVKNCSSSSSAYAGGSEGGGDSGSDSDPLSDDAPKQSLSQSKVAAHNKSMESSSSATSSSTVSSKQGRSLQQPSKQAQARAPMMFPPTMLPPNSAAPMPTMQQFPGSNMPYIIVQQPPGAAPGQQQQQPMIVQQQAPQQQQLLRVVNQSGGEVGYIQMPQQQPGMPMQVQPQQMMQAAPGGFVQAAPPGAQMAIQGMPGMQTFMPAMQAPQMQPMMQQWPPQMQAVTPQQVQQMAAMQQQQQMQQQMQMIHPSQMLATPQQMQQQQQQQQQPRFQQPLAFPTAPAPRK